MTATNPKGIAALIYLNVLEAMQEAEELGGPELPEYIELMEKISSIAKVRADVARDTFNRGGIKTY